MSDGTFLFVASVAVEDATRKSQRPALRLFVVLVAAALVAFLVPLVVGPVFVRGLLLGLVTVSAVFAAVTALI